MTDVREEPASLSIQHYRIGLGLLLLVGGVLRVFDLSILPEGLYCDEAANGYDAYSLLTTGKATDGQPYPLFLNHHGMDYVEFLYTYLTIPFVALFGLDVFSTRIVAALAGTLGILTSSLIGRQLFGKMGGLAVGLLVALYLWKIVFSRVAFRGILLPLFLTLSVYLFLRSLDDRRFCHSAASPSV